MSENKGLLEEAKRRFKQACEAEAKQREREREDLRFQVPEEQWDMNARKQREGDGKTPARPILSISKLDQPIQLVLNQARAAKLGVNIHPVSEDADKDTAEVLQGIYRRIERDSNADQARLWALDRATKCGRGWYRINTKWDEDAPETFDQEIVIERILHQDSVYADPSAQKPDFSDGEWAFVVSWVPIETFRRLYPKARLAVASSEEFSHSVTEAPEWAQIDGDKKAVLVAEYFYKEHETDTVEFGERKRDRDKVTVKWCKLTAHEILEKEIWDGQYIPLIPVVGRELQPFGSERRWVGMIGPAKDAQRFFNYAISTLVERMALEPKTPWVGAEGQFEGHEAEWDQSNVRNFSRLEYRLTALGDKLAPPPQRAQLDQTGMSLSMMGVQEADNLVQSSTSIYDPSLGKTTKQDESGRKILALQQQSDAGTSHFLASMADVSMPYEARVVLDLIPHKYDRRGRVTQILGGEDETKAVMLNAPFVKDPQTGQPILAQEGQEGAKLYKLGPGYAISVNIGKSFQTRLQEGGEMIGQILQAQPDLMPLIGPTYFQFQDWPGAKELAEILKKLRDKQFPGLGDDEEGPTPEQAQAQMQAMQGQLQELQMNLKMAVQQIETDRAKQEATILKTQMDNQTKERIAAADNETKLALAGMEAKFDLVIAALEGKRAQMQHREEMAHEVGMAAAGGKSATFKREGGQESDQESERESSQGASTESGSEAQSGPPEAEA